MPGKSSPNYSKHMPGKARGGQKSHDPEEENENIVLKVLTLEEMNCLLCS